MIEEDSHHQCLVCVHTRAWCCNPSTREVQSGSGPWRSTLVAYWNPHLRNKAKKDHKWLQEFQKSLKLRKIKLSRKLKVKHKSWIHLCFKTNFVLREIQPYLLQLLLLLITSVFLDSTAYHLLLLLLCALPPPHTLLWLFQWVCAVQFLGKSGSIMALFFHYINGAQSQVLRWIMIKFSYSIISFPWSFTSFRFVLYQIILTLFKSINLSIWSVIRRFKITILLGLFGFEFPLANKTSGNCSSLQYVLWPACQLLPWFSSSSSQSPPSRPVGLVPGPKAHLLTSSCG